MQPWFGMFSTLLLALRVVLRASCAEELTNNTATSAALASDVACDASFKPDIQTCKQLAPGLPHACQHFRLPGKACCTAVTSFTNAGCHCWQGLDAQLVADVSRMRGECQQQLAARTTAVKPRTRRAPASPGPEARVFVGVLTAGGHFEERDAIRKTWGSDPRLHRVMFFSAKPSDEAAFDALRREAAQRRDVVVLPHVWESYFNITHQTLELCRAASLDPAVTHVLKVDDDSYVRVPKLLARLQRLPRERLFLGWIEDPGGEPHRDPGNRWYVSPQEWPEEKYPPWAHGPGYVISADLVREIAAGAAVKASGHAMFKLEDIAMGSWLQYIAQEHGWKLHLVKDKRFNFYGCRSMDIVSHYMGPRKARCTWAAAGKCCSGEPPPPPPPPGRASRRKWGRG